MEAKEPDWTGGNLESVSLRPIFQNSLWRIALVYVFGLHMMETPLLHEAQAQKSAEEKPGHKHMSSRFAAVIQASD